MIQFDTQVKKNELGLRKQLNLDVKSTKKLDFSFNMLMYLYILQI